LSWLLQFLCHTAAAITLPLPSGDLFAIKVMTKTDLVRKNMVASVTNERNILAMVGPFLCLYRSQSQCYGRNDSCCDPEDLPPRQLLLLSLKMQSQQQSLMRLCLSA
jgi:hypothetical protein